MQKYKFSIHHSGRPGHAHNSIILDFDNYEDCSYAFEFTECLLLHVPIKLYSIGIFREIIIQQENATSQILFFD